MSLDQQRQELKRRALGGDEEAFLELQELSLRAAEAPRGWRLEAEIEVPGAEFSYREKRRTKTARLPAVKGNTPKVIKIGGSYSVSPGPKTVAAGKRLEGLLPRPAAPIEGEVRVEVDFVFEPAASWPKARRARALDGLEPCVQQNRGDLEQLTKLLNDALEARGYFPNDAAVVELEARKRYGPSQGYRVRLYSRASS